MRTASFGGSCPWCRKRRTFEYRSGVDVDGERGQRLVRRAGPLVVVDLVVGFGVEEVESIRPANDVVARASADLGPSAQALCVDHWSRAGDGDRFFERADGQRNRQLTGRSSFDQCCQGCGPKTAQLSLDCVCAGCNIHEFECTSRVSDPLLHLERVASQGDRDPGRTAPELSRTTPWIRPVLDCALAAAMTARPIATAITKLKDRRILSSCRRRWQRLLGETLRRGVRSGQGKLYLLSAESKDKLLE